MSTYRYLYIRCDDSMQGFNNRQLHPVNGQNVDFEYKQEPGNIFFRTLLKSSLIFMGEDYTFLKSIDASGFRCATNCLTIQKFCSGAWVDYWSGKFSFTFCKVNDDDCRIEFTPDVNDIYTCLLEAQSEYNILDISDIKTVRSESGNFYEFAVCSQSKNGPCLFAPPLFCGTNNTGTGHPYNGEIMCNPVTNTPPGPPYIIHDENVSFDCLPGGSYDGWQLYKNTTFITFPLLVAPTTQSIWFREVRITLDVGGVAIAPIGTTWVNQGPVVLGNGLHGHRWTRLPFDGANYDASHYSFIHGGSCENIWYYNLNITTGPIYTRARSLTSVLDFILEKTNCFPDGFTVVSDLLRINSALTPADPDYVTGLQSEVDHLMFFQKSDVIYPGSSEPASKAPLSWTVLMKILHGLFAGNPQYDGGVYWKIYPGNVIRIEHIKWFVENHGLDTLLPKYDEYTKRTKKYSFLKDELPNVEHFEFMEQDGIDFVGNDITYNTLCVNRDAVAGKSEIHLENVTTDVGFIQTDPTAIAKEGFVVMATHANNDGTFTLINGVGALSGLIILNAPLAWANIHAAYGKWGRIQPTGNMNGADTNFDSWIRTRRQEPFSIPLCCDDTIDYNDLIRSKLGWGKLETASFNTQSEKIKLTLLHY
jgi:hypothetical protein